MTGKTVWWKDGDRLFSGRVVAQGEEWTAVANITIRANGRLVDQYNETEFIPSTVFLAEAPAVQ